MAPLLPIFTLVGFIQPITISDLPTATELIDLALSARKKILSHDIAGSVESRQKKGAAKEELVLSKRIRSVADNGKLVIEYSSKNVGTGEEINNYTICRGCTKDNKIFMHSPKDGSTFSMSDSGSNTYVDRLKQMQFAGYYISHLETWSPTKTATLFESFPGVERTVVSEQGINGPILLLVQRITGKPGIQKYRIDPMLDYNITEITYAQTESEAPIIRTRSKYDKSVNGIYYPTEVEHTFRYGDLDLTETVRISSVKINHQIDPSEFDPARIGLRYNKFVADTNNNYSTKPAFFNGSMLQKTPPVPSEYINPNGKDVLVSTDESTRSAKRVPVAVFYASAAAFVVLAAFLFRRGLKRRG